MEAHSDIPVPGNKARAVPLALITVLFWSTVATAFKIGLKDLYPAQLIFIASGTTLLVLILILSFEKKIGQIFRLRFRHYLWAAFLGMLNPFAYYLLIFKGYSILPAQVAQPTNMIWPIVLVLLSVPLLKQKIRIQHILALLISFGGVLLIASMGKTLRFGKEYLSGIAFCLASSVIWSFYWILSARNKTEPVLGLFLNFLFGFIYLFLVLLLDHQLALPTGNGLLAGIYIGIFETGISFVLWLKAMSASDNNARIANLIYLAPFLSLIPIHFILKEPIPPTTLIGLFFIISGILVQQIRLKKYDSKK
ncbi:MAG TPA: DMT family transporter [Prolixibacteraceae bacterium]|nr:DMT family transporter [Prolixibacteraceae bacterium]